MNIKFARWLFKEFSEKSGLFRRHDVEQSVADIEERNKIVRGNVHESLVVGFRTGEAN